jgi:hypothetical protein
MGMRSGGSAGLAVDAQNVYWTEPVTTAGGVIATRLSGGPDLMLARDQGEPTHIVVLGPTVYWTNTAGGEVMAAPIVHDAFQKSIEAYSHGISLVGVEQLTQPGAAQERSLQVRANELFTHRTFSILLTGWVCRRLLDGVSDTQVVVLGKSVGSMAAVEYDQKTPEMRGVVAESLARLREDYDLVVIEGAGSPAGINLPFRNTPALDR